MLKIPRSLCALLCLLLLPSMLPVGAAQLTPGVNTPAAQRALELFEGQSCAVRAHTYMARADVQPDAQATPTDTPSASPTPVATPTFPPTQGGPAQLYATPRPQSSTTPPPVPTPSPNANASGGPIYLVRGPESPPPITPAGKAAPAPAPIPTGAATLEPGKIAILSDSVDGNMNTDLHKPGTAHGNVHIFYGAEELIGDKAYYDGNRTVTLTGHPYVINHAKDSLISGNEIDYDTIDQTSKIDHPVAVSNEGLEDGLLHFKGDEMHTTADGNGHGTNAFVTTCENPRGGYHLTSKKYNYYAGDKIVLTDVFLYLGAAVVFFLPRVVIPLRTVTDETSRPSFFPVVGYDQSEGLYVKTQLGFGKDQYYYGYYRIEYFSKVGLGLGYVGTLAKKNGRRAATINYYGIHDRRTETSTKNLTVQEQENFSRTLRGNFSFNYQNNYGPLTSVPANTQMNATIVHSTLRSSQNYQFTRSAVGTQSSSDSFAFSDNNQLSTAVTQSENISLTRSTSAYGGVVQSTSGAHVTTLTNWNTRALTYTMTFDKSFSQTPSGDDKLPEFVVRPTLFFPHFVFPVSSSLTVGEYSEPSNDFATSRADLGFVLGPALYKVFQSDFQATFHVDQYAYATGDLKAAITQQMSLTTPVTSHISNSLSYNETNYNGPAIIPFQFLDQLKTNNTKGAQDLLRFFNSDVYSLQLGFSTLFQALAQPVSYQLSLRPTARSAALIGGSFVPGPGEGHGFGTTNVQFSTPLGYETTVNFIGNLDWPAHGRIENKAIFIDKIIGECYDIKVQYNQDSRQVNFVIDLLAFPSHATGFGLGGRQGSLIPSTFNL